MIPVLETNELSQGRRCFEAHSGISCEKSVIYFTFFRFGLPLFRPKCCAVTTGRNLKLFLNLLY